MDDRRAAPAPARPAPSTPDVLVAEPLDPRWRDAAPAVWLEGWSPRRFAVAGGELEGVTAGEGPPLILLPPMPGWKEAYVALVPRLARTHRVTTFDLRAHFAPGRAPLEQLVDDAERVVGAIASGPVARSITQELVAGAVAREPVGGSITPEPVAVFGHSLGGAIAIAWAIAHPERVRALVLSSAFARVFTPPGGLIARWIEQPLALAGMRWLPERASRAWTSSLASRAAWVFDRHCDEATVELTRFGARHLSLALARERLGLAFSIDLRARLGEVRCPVLLVVGERDTAFARAACDELAARLPRAERRVIAGAGHLHPLSRPDELAREVVEWLGGLGAGRPDQA